MRSAPRPDRSAAMTDARRPLGRIVTFYSYKGGTGRSMALANIAWILAGGGKRVLVVDWDLEAPGLHRYFRPFLLDKRADASRRADRPGRPSTPTRPSRPTRGRARRPDWYRRLRRLHALHVVSLDCEHFPSRRRARLPPGRPAGRRLRAARSARSTGRTSTTGSAAARSSRRSSERAARRVRLRPDRQPHRRQRHRRDLHRADARRAGGLLHLQQPEHQGRRRGGAIGAARCTPRLAEERLARRARGGDGSPAALRTRRGRTRLPVPMRVDAGESERLALRQAFARSRSPTVLAHRAERDRRVLEQRRGAAQRLLRLRGGAGAVQGQRPSIRRRCRRQFVRLTATLPIATSPTTA